MKAAFYTGTRPGKAGLYNRLVRWWTTSPYSHVELVFSDGIAASSSYADGGVRFKVIDFEPRSWEFIELPLHLEADARAWFAAHAGAGYDLRGNLHFMVEPLADRKDAWFCSEAVAAALGFREPWRYDPGVLASTLRSLPRNPLPVAA